MKKKYYKMNLCYDGTNYFGWQIQPNKKTIQQTIQDTLKIILKEPINITGAGRTDAGVHSLGQVAHFSTDKECSIRSLTHSLNSLLNKDIRIKKIEEVDSKFHSRYCAKSKIYQYHLNLSQQINPFNRLYSYKPIYKIDLDLLKQACKILIGKHDFTSFANRASEGCAKNKPVKNLKRIDIKETQEGLILEFEADGFLYKMVRNLVGTLLDVANNKISPDHLRNILESKDRTQAGKTAPAHGLFLKQVKY